MAFTKMSAGAASSVGMGGSANASNAAAGGMGTLKGWHPTVVYMLGLVIVEIIVVGFLSRHLFRGE